MTPVIGFSYPHFIGKGYHACLTCHYNPFGNGPLNDYGRGVSATGLSGRLFMGEDVSDQDLSNRSGFLLNNPQKMWLKPALDYRRAVLDTDIRTDDGEPRYITMVADVSLSAVFGKAKDWIVTMTYGMVPSDSIPGGKAEYDVEAGDDLTFSREHYIGKRITPEVGVYLGKMDKVFGIRVPDHTAFSRSVTSNNQYSSTHGAVVHYGKQSFDLGVQYFIGDLEKEEEYRSSGLATKFEYSITKDVRLGVSYQNETFDNDSKLDSKAFIFKSAIGEGSSLMAEYGFQDRYDTEGEATPQQYFFMQNHILLTKGLYYLTTFEQYNANTEQTNNIYRLSPGVQWFPLQRFELRADLINQKTISTTSATRDEWMFLGQVHIWL
ncbi:MAG: hypothetical protein CME62_17030 [Halobacteriovoraceae bacterium]|nr:hypothetical protein [Halobacteriovoraceae bacterium]